MFVYSPQNERLKEMGRVGGKERGLEGGVAHNRDGQCEMGTHGGWMEKGQADRLRTLPPPAEAIELDCSA